MFKYFKTGKDGWSKWTRPNEEGVSAKDAFFMFIIPTGMFLFFANIFMYLNCHPDVVEKIGMILYPLNSCK